MKRALFIKRFLTFLLIVICQISTGNFSVASENSELTVMSRNLYLGSDVAVAMKLIPNMSKAAQFMWDQVRANDFSQRAPLLAQELITSGAQVIGIQEATTWRCRTGFFSKEVVVYDFLAELISALKAKGGNYSIAAIGEKRALNPGFEISPIPHLTMVNDESTFMPIFGKSKAACGFTISDALLIRDDVKTLDVGTSEYSATYSIKIGRAHV